MGYIKTAIALAIIAIANSCTKPYTIDFDKIEKRVVVNSLFYPDSLMKFKLTEEASLSENVLHNNFKTITDAQIIIYGNNTIIDTANYVINGNYYTNFKPQNNATYKIEIAVPGYNNVTDESQIPTIVDIDSLSVNKNDDNTYRVKIIFDDPANEDNYYFLYVSWKREYEGGIWWDETYIKTEDPAIGEWLTQSFQIPIFSDDIFNGERYELNIDLFVSNLEKERGYCYFDLRSISKSMYLYIKSYNKQTPKFGDDLMELFQQGLIEPIPIYTNIEGGLGVFGGYDVSIDSVFFE